MMITKQKIFPLKFISFLLNRSVTLKDMSKRLLFWLPQQSNPLLNLLMSSQKCSWLTGQKTTYHDFHGYVWIKEWRRTSEHGNKKQRNIPSHRKINHFQANPDLDFLPQQFKFCPLFLHLIGPFFFRWISRRRKWKIENKHQTEKRLCFEKL